MLSGNCLCGDIQYELNHDIHTLIFCHCSRCRKESSSTFNTATPIPASTLLFTKGKDKLGYFSENRVTRTLCPRCGSHFYTVRDNDPDTFRFRVGTLNTPIYPEKKIHIFTDSKASWDTICDDYPQFAEMPA